MHYCRILVNMLVTYARHSASLVDSSAKKHLDAALTVVGVSCFGYVWYVVVVVLKICKL